jgi:hypothetical protein
MATTTVIKSLTLEGEGKEEGRQEKSDRECAGERIKKEQRCVCGRERSLDGEIEREREEGGRQIKNTA